MTQEQSAKTLAMKAYHYWRVAGTKELLVRARAYLHARAVRGGQEPTSASAHDVASVLSSRFKALTPIPVFHTAPEGRRITVITDSISKGSLFGGVGTSLLLAALVAQRARATFRIVTRDAASDARGLGSLLKVNGVDFDRPTELRFMPPDTRDQLPIHSADRFITTSWWTTVAAQRIPWNAQFYLLQEDERLFYPAGDDTLRCTAVMTDQRIRPIVNSKLLYDHLCSEFPDLATRGSYFEPAFPRGNFHWQQKTTDEKRTLFFYARPNNPRNLFYLGCEVLRRAVEQGLLPPNRWRLVLCGKNIPRLEFAPPIEVEYAENMTWDEYAEKVRSSDVGLSLMLTPHPSYPPLDLAASGAVVVTTACGQKTNLDRYSENILVAKPEVGALTDALREAVCRAENETERRERYERNALERDWTHALAGTVDRIEASYR